MGNAIMGVRLRREWPHNVESAMSTDDHNIPTTIMAQIRRQASEDWADDPDMLNHMIDEECEAFEELHTMKIENLLTSVLMGLKEAAGREHPMSYSEQLDYVRNEAKRYLYVRKLRKDIEPIKDLLIKIEKLSEASATTRIFRIMDPVVFGKAKAVHLDIRLQL